MVSHSTIAELGADSDPLMRVEGTPVPRNVNPKMFFLTWTTSLRKSRGRSTEPVLEGISDNLEIFYGEVVQKLSAYVPPAPKLPRKSEATETVENDQPSKPTANTQPDVGGEQSLSTESHDQKKED